MPRDTRGHLIMRPSARDRINLGTITGHLRAVLDREPNTADILRHALQVAADAAVGGATERDRPEMVG